MLMAALGLLLPRLLIVSGMLHRAALAKPAKASAKLDPARKQVVSPFQEAQRSQLHAACWQQ